MDNNWSSNEVANTVCAIHGHKLGNGPTEVEMMCFSCGLTIDEIRKGKMEETAHAASA